MELLYYTLMALPYLVALALGVLVPVLMVLSYSRMGVGAGLLAVAFCLNATFPGLSQGGLQLGIRLDITDLAVLLLIPITVLRFALDTRARPHAPAFYVFLLVLAYNVLHGLVVFKAAAGASARPEIYAATAAAYVATFTIDRQRLQSLLRVAGFAVLWLSIVTLYRWVLVAFDIRELLPPSGSFQPAGHSPWRVIVSNETLLMGQFAILAWFFSRRQQLLQSWQWVALPLLAFVLVLQHRSAWVAVVFGLLAAMLAVRVAGAKALGRALPLMMALVALVGGVVIAGRGSETGSDVAQSAADAVALRGTAASRLGSWQQLVKNWAGSGPHTIALGNPSGTTYLRYDGEELGARQVQFQAHNYYVTVLTTHGLVCFIAFLAMLGHTALRLLQAMRQPGEGEVAGILLVMLAAQGAYYLTYGTDYMQWLFLGAAMSYASRVGQPGSGQGQRLQGRVTPRPPGPWRRPPTATPHR